jgi:putative ABC transport system permease protein
MYFSSLVYKNVTVRSTRTVLTICGLTAAIAAVVALVGISNGFVRSFQDVYEGHGVDLVVSRAGAVDRLSSAMEESSAQRIGSLDGVHDASGFLLETMSLEEAAVYGVPTIGISPESAMVHDYDVVSGRSLAPGDQGKKVMVVGRQLATRLNHEIGQRVAFYEDEEFEVIGIFQSRSAWENGSLMIPLDQLQRLADRPGQVTFVNVVLDGVPNQDDIERVADEIQGLDTKLAALPTEDFVRTDARMQLAGGMAWMTSSVALLIGAIGMFNTMMTSVYERTREIGILRAVGWKKSRIVRMILMEASLLSLVAATLGSLAGVLITWTISRLPSAGATIAPHIDGWVILQGFLIALVIGLLGAAWPALRGARLPPTVALRQD